MGFGQRGVVCHLRAQQAIDPGQVARVVTPESSVVEVVMGRPIEDRQPVRGAPWEVEAAVALGGLPLPNHHPDIEQADVDADEQGDRPTSGSR